MDYVIHILVLCCIYTTLSVSLDLLAGRTGLLSIAHAAFYGLGAYTTALLAVHLSMPFILSVTAGVVVSVVFSLVVAIPSLRLHEDYFVIATFGFQMILFSVLNNWVEVTRGPLGIPGIPSPEVFGWTIDSPVEFLVLAGTFAALAYFVVYRLVSSPFGRVLHAIREDEVFALANGKNVVTFKVIAFVVSAALAAVAGGVFAHYITYIDPSSFTVMESILIISMVIIGGAGSRWGPLVGALVLVLLPEVLRFIGLPIGVAANLRQIFYGSLLVVMMVVRPQGLMGRYTFGT